MQTRDVQETPLQTEAKRLVVKLAWLGGLLSAVAAVGYGVAKHDALAGLLAGLTLAMAILPNEVPVVVTMFLGSARGASHAAASWLAGYRPWSRSAR